MKLKYYITHVEEYLNLYDKVKYLLIIAKLFIDINKLDNKLVNINSIHTLLQNIIPLSKKCESLLLLQKIYYYEVLILYYRVYYMKMILIKEIYIQNNLC